MPNGYADVVRGFTKILKLPFALLRKLENLFVVYIDDTYFQSGSFLECMHNLEDTVALLQAPDFSTHSGKSNLYQLRR